MGKLCMKMTLNVEVHGEDIWVNYVWKWSHAEGLGEGMKVAGNLLRGPVLKNSEKVLG